MKSASVAETSPDGTCHQSSDSDPLAGPPVRPALFSCEVQTDLTSAGVNSMEKVVESYFTDVYIKNTGPSSSSFSFCDISEFSEDDNKVKYYTGLPNFKTLSFVFDFVRQHVECGKSLGQFQEFILVLMKLRLNLGMQDLAYRAGVSLSTVSRILYKWLIAMDVRLSKACIVWPDRDDLCKTMPLCFKSSFGNKVVVIIDCFEVFIDRPSNILARVETWSQYKHHNTAKFLLGIAPQGVITFISSGWGGRVSDKFLTENSGLLDKLLPGDVVLADRGFTVADTVAITGARLYMPAFTKGKSQLSALEVEESRVISNVRIHVERVIGLVRQKYTILGGPLPVDFIQKRSDQSAPLIDRMVRVCCSLCNLCDSVVPFS